MEFVKQDLQNAEPQDAVGASPQFRATYNNRRMLTASAVEGAFIVVLLGALAIWVGSLLEPVI